jgi:peptidoglycan/LPS O-acetylase OafA/YrhL
MPARKLPAVVETQRPGSGSEPHAPGGVSSLGSPPQELRSLTGIRAVAALLVLGVHLTYLWRFSHVFSHLNAVTEQGDVGVSLFFILSGFVLTYSHRPFDRPANFWRRRVARIVPAYVVAVFLSIPVSAFEHRSGYLAPTAFQLTLLQAWIPKAIWFSGGDHVGWSLSVEAFFYLIFPVIIGYILRMSPRQRFALAVGVIVYATIIPLLAHPTVHDAARQVSWRFWLPYISPIARVAEFIIGILLCTFLRDPGVPRIPLRLAGVIAAAAYLLDAHVPTYLAYVVITLIPFSLLILACAQHDQRPGARSPLGSRPVVALGRWSYAFYLTHQLLIRVFERMIVVDHLTSPVKALGVVVLIPLTWFVAWLLYTVIEMPFEKRLRAPVARARAEDARSGDDDRRTVVDS